jgi:hypothetical protein
VHAYPLKRGGTPPLSALACLSERLIALFFTDGDIDEDVSHRIKVGWLKLCQAPKDSQRNGKSSEWHLLGPEFDSQWERIFGPWVKKSPRCALPALGLHFLFATLLLGRCRVGSRCRLVNDGRPGFGNFLGLHE